MHWLPETRTCGLLAGLCETLARVLPQRALLLRELNVKHLRRSADVSGADDTPHTGTMTALSSHLGPLG